MDEMTDTGLWEIVGQYMRILHACVTMVNNQHRKCNDSHVIHTIVLIYFTLISIKGTSQIKLYRYSP